MRSDIHSLFPKIYNGVLETDILADVEDVQFNEYFLHMDDARRNQFVLTADIRGIEALERIYEIKANPFTEDLEFRRQRLLNRMRMKIPFTYRFLLQRLDDLIGAGRYNAWLGRGNWNYRLGSWALGREAFRDPEYTLFIETTMKDANWYHEVQVFVNQIKPANIVYVLSPLVARGLLMAETISLMPSVWNYRLGSWRLGSKAFRTDRAMEVIKLPEISSITPLFLNLHARYTAAEIASVRLNGEYVISSINKRIEGDAVVLSYVVPPASGLKEITRIELLKENGDILDSAGVYVPVTVADQLAFKHTITHKEASVNG